VTSERTAVITQPTYLPWLGYFQQIARADVFVILDTVQFEKQSWQNRNRLKSASGETFWLTVPIAKQPLETLLLDVRIAPQEQRWREKHLRSIQGALGRAPFFQEIFPRIERWLRTPQERLADSNVSGIELICECLGLSPKTIRASQLTARGSKAELVASICREIGATRYLANAGSRDYIEQDHHYFDDAGVGVEFQDWPHPTYAQQGPGFVSHLPAIDALMNLGTAAVRTILRSSPSQKSA